MASETIEELKEAQSEAQEESEIFYSLSEAARYCKVTRQAIFCAIKKNELQAQKREYTTFNGELTFRWAIRATDLDSYRGQKYITERRKFRGERVYDIADNRWSVLHAAKYLSNKLRRPVSPHNIYYMIRCGVLSAQKRGSAWVLSKDDVLKAFHVESMKDAKLYEKYQQELEVFKRKVARQRKKEIDK